MNTKRKSTARRRLITEQLEARNLLAGPYAPAAGVIGSEAIRSQSNQIVGWASAVADYTAGTDVDAVFQTPENSLGPSDPLGGEANAIPDTVSLGRGGQITLTFDHPIRDGIGDDFAVFENSFSDTFLELAFVEVSADGLAFTRFDNDSLTLQSVEAFGSIDPTDVDGLAGKYRGGFGVGFDLSDVGLDSATHVRIVDIVGDGGTTDTSGDVIHDPHPTVGSAGFDLDAVAVLHQTEVRADVVDFEDVGEGLAAASFYNGPDPDGMTTTGPFSDTVVLGAFQSETLALNNNFSQDFGSWNGFAYSNVTDNATAGFENQYSSITGNGARESATYGVGFVPSDPFYDPPTITRDAGDDRSFDSVAITNTTYAALSMANGDMFAKKFGGASGDDPDFLSLTITGLDSVGDSIGDIEFFLADFRFADNSLDYIIDDWTTIDLSSLADARSLQFAIDSSDVGSFGINTPTYFAIDDITLVQPVLPIGLADDKVSEDAGANATTLRISRVGSDTSEPISVSLASSDPDTATVSSNATIAMGQSFVDVPVSIIDNDVLSDDRDVTITASAAGFADASTDLSIINDDVTLRITSTVSTLSESDSPPTATAEEVGRTLAPESFANRFDDSGGFDSDGIVFNNEFNSTFQSWSGWAVSNVTDNTTGGFGNQYAAITGIGSAGSDTYMVGNAFPGGFVPTITRDPSATASFTSIDITNTAYAAISMRDGDAFAKQFGGTDGTDPDFFKLTIEGFAADQSSVGTVDVDLADFSFIDDSLDFILDSWVSVDLSAVADAIELQFSLASSDVGDFGMNTPAYFAADNVRTSGIVAPPTLTVSRETSETLAPLEVTLTSSDASEIVSPMIVAIPAGRDSVQVPITVAKDFLTDGEQMATVTATAVGFAGDSVELTITDADVPELTLSFASLTIAEDGETSKAVVHRNAVDLSSPSVVTLASSDTQRLTVPTTVTIPVGQRSVQFDVTIIDNESIEVDQTVSITATSDTSLTDQVTVTVNDDDAAKPALSISVDRSAVGESDAPAIIGFEDVGSATAHDSFNNGSDLSAGFQSGTVSLNNEFNAAFSSWSGWSISNVTDNQTAGFTNQYSAISGGGSLSSATYAVGNTFGAEPPSITLGDSQQSFTSIDITNSTYAALSMRDGDSFAKAFGGESGDDPDFFLLTIDGLDTSGQSVGTIDFYLADYRFDDNSLDYIIDDWNTVDVSGLDGAVQLAFSLSSSDVGDFGMNTPAYFTVDNVVLASPGDMAAATAMIARENSDIGEALQVTVTSSDDSEVSVPQIVTIPAGQSSVVFPVSAVDDAVVDGEKSVTLTVGSDGFRPGEISITVTDNDIPTLTVTPSTPSISESVSDTSAAMLIHHNFESLDEPLELSISSSSNDLSLPSNVSIAVGAASVSVDLSVVDNDVVDGDRMATVDVSDDDSLTGSSIITITDDEVAGIETLFSGDAPFTITELMGDGTIDVTLSGKPLGQITVAITPSSDQVIVNPGFIVFTPENWNVAQTVSVVAVPDLIEEDLQTVTLSLIASDANDAKLYEAIEATMSVDVLDYQSSNLVIREVGDSISVEDSDLGLAVLESGFQFGVNVQLGALAQQLTLESLLKNRGPVTVNAGDGDDRVTLLGSRFTMIDGGDGFDTLVLGIPGSIDLSNFIDQRIFGFEQIVVELTEDENSVVSLDDENLDRLVDSDGKLLLRISQASSLNLNGDFQSLDPVIVADEFRQVLGTADFEVEVVSTASWQNAGDRFDVNRSGDVSPLDALQIINFIAKRSEPALDPITSMDQFDGRFYDVNGDNQSTAVDALQVINQLARQQDGAEPEQFDRAIGELYSSRPTAQSKDDSDALPWWIGQDAGMIF